jgi:hypothetical protein
MESKRTHSGGSGRKHGVRQGRNAGTPIKRLPLTKREQAAIRREAGRLAQHPENTAIDTWIEAVRDSEDL